MNLFINAVSENGVLILFDENRSIVKRQDIKVLGNESSKLINVLDDFLKLNEINYHNLENIVVVSGPGSFTGIRTISLLVNTINYVTKKCITDISYFDLFKEYPICKPSSKRDTFIQKEKNQSIEIVKNTDLIDYFNDNKINKIYGELNTSYFKGIEVLDRVDYESIILGVKFKENKLIKPLYIKKPSIT